MAVSTVTVSIKDFSGETSKVSYHIPPPTSAGEIADMFTNLASFITAYEGVALGSVQGSSILFQTTQTGNPLPTDPNAQREIKLLVLAADDVTGLPVKYEVPCPDLTLLGLNAGSDVVDLTATNVAPLVTWFNDHGYSNQQNTVTVQQMRVVGRNL